MSENDQSHKPAAQIRVNIDARCEPLFMCADVVSPDGTVLIARVVCTGPQQLNPKILTTCLEMMVQKIREMTSLVVPAMRIPD